ncbi:hypothetical protein Leryth_018749 [Lithospermum erythrorhizon]|nr:hypothetical protein Leryth_018749 [Lithospermum erythrorhizon]
MEAKVDEKKIIIGVCVMEKKAFSGPMKQILDRLQAFGEFEVIHFGDKAIVEDPIERVKLQNFLYLLGEDSEKVGSGWGESTLPLNTFNSHGTRSYAMLRREKDLMIPSSFTS